MSGHVDASLTSPFTERMQLRGDGMLVQVRTQFANDIAEKLSLLRVRRVAGVPVPSPRVHHESVAFRVDDRARFCGEQLRVFCAICLIEQSVVVHWQI